MELIIFIYAIIIITGLVLIPSLGGFNKNIPYVFTIVILIIYSFITPIHFWNIGRRTAFGDGGAYNGIGRSILGFYEIGLLNYAIGLFFFIVGYNIIRINRPFKVNDLKLKTAYGEDLKPYIFFIFFISISLVLLNFAVSGINIADVIMGSRDEALLGAKTKSNYLRNFADTIITCLLLLYFFDSKKKYLFPLVLLSFLLFLLMGFRYRLILTLFGFFFIYGYKNKIGIKQLLSLLFGVVFFIYITLFITVNRYNFIYGNYKELIYSPNEFEYEIFFEQTRGALADMTVMKYYQDETDAVYDYGVTHLYFIVRMMPRSVFGNLKDRLYPPPAFDVIVKAYKLPPEFGSQGEATLHYAYFYIGYGRIGIIIGSFLFGLMLKFTKFILPPIYKMNWMFSVVLALALFQWVTRGYFPQFVDHLLFMSLPFIFIPILKRTGITQKKYQINE